MSGRNNNNFHFAHLVLRPEIKSGPRRSGRVPVWSSQRRIKELKILARRIANVKEETVVISSEAMCYFRDPSEKKMLEEFIANCGRQVKTLVVFREESEWRRSWGNELRSGPSGPVAIASREPTGNSVAADWYYDKEAIRNFWSSFNLHEIDFAKTSNVVETLYQEIGFPLENLETGIFRNKTKTDAVSELSEN